MSAAVCCSSLLWSLLSNRGIDGCPRGVCMFTSAESHVWHLDGSQEVKTLWWIPGYKQLRSAKDQTLPGVPPATHGDFDTFPCCAHESCIRLGAMACQLQMALVPKKRQSILNTRRFKAGLSCPFVQTQKLLMLLSDDSSGASQWSQVSFPWDPHPRGVAVGRLSAVIMT